MEQKLRFAEILEYHLNAMLQGFLGELLTKDTMEKMYLMIESTVDSVFSKSSENFSDITRRWIAQEYYMAIKMHSIIDENHENWKYQVSSVRNNVDIKDIPRNELRRLAGLFSGMTFYEKIKAELNRSPL